MSAIIREERIGDCRLILGDCLEVLPEIGSVDAVVTDPPYCSGGATEASRGRATHQGLRSETMRNGRFSWFDGDNMTTAGLVWLLRMVCVRAQVVDSGSIVAFTDWRMVTSLAPAMESAGYRLRNLLVWDKGHFGAGTGFRPRHEMALHLTKQSPKFYSASVGNVIAGKRVWSAERDHPTQKPLEVMADIIRVVAPDGGTVADPFAGSGSTIVASARLGRAGIGIERDPDYFEVACRRVEDAYRQPDMFIEPPQPPKQEAMDL